MKREKACGGCSGYVPSSKQKACTEYNRLCFSWPKAPVNFHGNSVVSGVSSIFDLTEADLTKYKTLLEAIREAALDLEGMLNSFPEDSAHRTNPRYSRERTDRDVLNEEIHMSKIEEILADHASHQERLAELTTELGDHIGDELSDPFWHNGQVVQEDGTKQQPGGSDQVHLQSNWTFSGVLAQQKLANVPTSETLSLVGSGQGSSMSVGLDTISGTSLMDVLSSAQRYQDGNPTPTPVEDGGLSGAGSAAAGGPHGGEPVVPQPTAPGTGRDTITRGRGMVSGRHRGRAQVPVRRYSQEADRRDRWGSQSGVQRCASEGRSRFFQELSPQIPVGCCFRTMQN